MKSFVVDTNALVRFLLNDIPGQVEAVEGLLKKAKNRKIELFIPQIVIFEIEFVLRKVYNTPKEVIVEGLTSLISMDCLQIQDKESLRYGLKLFRDNNLSFVDCFLYAIAEKENAEIFTFDKKLQKLKD